MANNPGDLNQALLTTPDHLVVLEITTTTSNAYLEWMKRVAGGADEEEATISKQWYDKPEVVIKLRNRILKFIAESHTSDDSFHFIATCRKVESSDLMDDDDKRVIIKIFTDGEEDRFEASDEPLSDLISNAIKKRLESSDHESDSDNDTSPHASMPLEEKAMTNQNKPKPKPSSKTGKSKKSLDHEQEQYFSGIASKDKKEVEDELDKHFSGDNASHEINYADLEKEADNELDSIN